MSDATSPGASLFENPDHAPTAANLDRYPANAGKARLIKYAAFFAAFLIAIYIRRSAQIQHPQVWDEEGTVLIPDYLNHGAMSLFHPLNGYLVLATKIILYLSIHISFLYYAGVSTTLSWIFTALVCVAITFSPTWLRGRAVLGFCAIFVPTDAEVIGVPLYAFWWATLLLFLVVLWDNDSRDLLIRCTFLILGGLSTPIIVLVAPLLAVRLILLKHKRRNATLLAVSILCAVIQFLQLHYSPAARTHHPTWQDVLEIIPRFFGTYVLGNFSLSRIILWIAGGSTVVFILAAMRWDRQQPLFPFLLFLCFGCIMLAAARNPLEILTPYLAGPRYFFFPDILISWMLVNLAAPPRGAIVRTLAGALLLLAIANVFPVLSRKHTDLHWSDHVASSAHFVEYSIPIQIDGYSEPWHLPIQQKQARSLLTADLFATSTRLASFHPFPFTTFTISTDPLVSIKPLATISALTDLQLPAAHFTAKPLPGFTITSPFLHPKTGRVTLSLRLHRGEGVLYCSGKDAGRQFVRILNSSVDFSTNLPTSTEWTILEFSSDQLSQEFTAVFSDHGSSHDEWCAIALKNSKQ